MPIALILACAAVAVLVIVCLVLAAKLADARQDIEDADERALRLLAPGITAIRKQRDHLLAELADFRTKRAISTANLTKANAERRANAKNGRTAAH